LGLWLNRPTFVPLFDVPFFAVIVLAVSAGSIYLLKKVPILKKLVG
jgi:hypothetical protein